MEPAASELIDLLGQRFAGRSGDVVLVAGDAAEEDVAVLAQAHRIRLRVVRWSLSELHESADAIESWCRRSGTAVVERRPQISKNRILFRLHDPSGVRPSPPSVQGVLVEWTDEAVGSFFAYQP